MPHVLTYQESVSLFELGEHEEEECGLCILAVSGRIVLY